MPDRDLYTGMYKYNNDFSSFTIMMDIGIFKGIAPENIGRIALINNCKLCALGVI